jgi:DNA-binding transcriptional ArsR family regulator
MRMHEDKKICGLDPHSDYVELAAEVFSLLADPTRVRIVLSLHRHGELSVGDLADIVGKSASGVSQHLARLRMARVVTTRQDGTRVWYRLADEHVFNLVSEAVKQAEHTVSNGQLPPHRHGSAT